MAKKLQFKVSSALKRVIGRDLITNDFVAIFELVKNSVDAGASKIQLVFDLDSHSGPAIYIIDNGKGMSFDDIQDKWLFLGYSAKQDGTEDKNRRVYAGNKGVGRFSCDRLGGKLRLQTRSRRSAEISQVDVDWGDFERDPKEFFTKIDIIYQDAKKFEMPADFSPPPNGVVLKISELREEGAWTRSKLLRLKSNLAKLINPFGGQKSSVEVKIHCPRELAEDKIASDQSVGKNVGIEVVNGLVENHILDVLRDKTTWIHCRVDQDGYLYSELTDRGELIYKVREKLHADFKPLQDSRFSSTMFFLNRAAKLTFSRRMAMSSLVFGSIFLFRNGFRVFPVGEEGNDYWLIDRRKQQGHSRYLGTRDIMGRVDVYGSDQDFKESSSRDKGLVETPASKSLDACVQSCLRRLERYVVGIAWKDVLDKDFETIERMQLSGNRARIIKLIHDLVNNNDIEVLDFNRDLVGILEAKSIDFEPSLSNLREVAEKLGDRDLVKKVEQAEKALKRSKQDELEALDLAEKEEASRRKAEQAAVKAQKEKDQAEQAYAEEKKRNLFLLSSGSRDKDQLENFIHQMIYFAGHNKRLINNQLRAISGHEGSEWEPVRDAFFQLREGIEKIITTSRYLTSANFRLESGKIEADLIGFIVDHLTVMAPMFTSGVDIHVNAPEEEFVMRFSPIEMGMIYDNVISNSKKARASEIVFDIQKKGKILEVIAADNGRGLSDSIADKADIFDKGFTRTRGSGLGLYFCREQTQNLGGDIQLHPEQPEQGISLLIRFVQA